MDIQDNWNAHDFGQERGKYQEIWHIMNMDQIISIGQKKFCQVDERYKEESKI
jgi:hypothetical protein